MHRHTIFHSYCRYYGRYYYRMMTVVTTVAMENRTTTHAIFFLIYRCPMSGTVFKKKSSFKNDDEHNNDNDAMVCSTPRCKRATSQKQRRMRVSRRPHDSWTLSGAHGVLSHHWNPSKLHVSMAAGAMNCTDIIDDRFRS